jgi:hypothetical protein
MLSGNAVGIKIEVPFYMDKVKNLLNKKVLVKLV